MPLLRVSPVNPRYFTDGSGKAILLVGSHTWGDLQDYTYDKLPSPPALDFDAYLAFLKQHHHNFFRLWVWESAFNPNAKQGTITYDPMPYQRPGPGLALDGKPKFDLKLFHLGYFDRLRSRVVAARDNGIYVSIMLFNGFSVEGKGNVGGDPWQGHPCNLKNNVNGIDAGSGRAIHTLAQPAITALQEAYIRKIILNDTDHSYFWTGLKQDGPAAQRAWVWENFTRGNQCLFMDPYLDPSHDPGRNHPAGGKPDPYWDTLREAMGRTRACAERMNLAAMVPHDELASTTFCLADPGREYLVYLPQGGEVTVDLRAASGMLNTEWLHPVEGAIFQAKPIAGGDRRTVKAPFPGDAVLYLKNR